MARRIARVEDGYREGAERWKTLLRELKRVTCRPLVGVGNGSLGLEQQRTKRGRRTVHGCWSHKLVKVVDKLGHLDG
jgi:hypothetical protein